MLRPLSAVPDDAARPVGRPDQGGVEQLQGALVGAREQRGQGDAGEVERRCQSEHPEVGHRDQAFLGRADQGIALGRVQLDGQAASGVGEGVAGGAVHRRQRAEGERVLEVARGSLPRQR